MFLNRMVQRRIRHFISLKHLQKEARRILLFTFFFGLVLEFKRWGILCSLLPLYIYWFKILFKINCYVLEQANSLKNYTRKDSCREWFWLSLNHKLLSWWKRNCFLRLCHHHRKSTSRRNIRKFYSWGNDKVLVE